jgi:hypothetical protein
VNDVATAVLAAWDGRIAILFVTAGRQAPGSEHGAAPATASSRTPVARRLHDDRGKLLG